MKTEYIRLLCTALLGVGLLFATPIELLQVAGAIFVFNAFDVVGFRYITANKGGTLYRLVQLVAQAVLCIYLYKQHGFEPVIAFNIAWYLLTIDVLYYWVVDIPLGDFSWWRSSPVVFYAIHIRKLAAAPAAWVATSAAIGAILAVLIILL